MKINNSPKEIEEIRFDHKGAGLHFSHKVPGTSVYMGGHHTDPPGEVLRIEFSDTEEIAALIKMLETFLHMTKEFTGNYVRK